MRYRERFHMKRRVFKAFPYSSILTFIFRHSTAVQAGALIHARTQKRRQRRRQRGVGGGSGGLAGGVGKPHL